jgi:hypothetical protein
MSYRTGLSWSVVPSVPIHTNTVIRGNVEWTDSTVRIVAPQTARDTTPSSLTKDPFLAALDHIRPGTSNRLVEFLERGPLFNGSPAMRSRPTAIETASSQERVVLARPPAPMVAPTAPRV